MSTMNEKLFLRRKLRLFEGFAIYTSVGEAATEVRITILQITPQLAREQLRLYRDFANYTSVGQRATEII